MNKSAIMPVFLLCIFLIFFYGVINLFEMRFESGDVYPQYSSLRSDPLGTKALYESLGNIQGVTVRRNYRPLSQAEESDQNSTVFYLGLSGNSLEYVDEEEVSHLESLMEQGWHAVILLHPNYAEKKECTDSVDNECPDNGPKKEKKPSDSSDDVTIEDDADRGITEKPQTVSLFDRWGFDLSRRDAHENNDENQYDSGKLATDRYVLPPSVSWNRALYVQHADQRWNNIYSINNDVVMMERYFGKGKVVLATDTYLASNEAMWKERHPDLLVWLVGPNSNVIIDETHLGIHEKAGIAVLAKRYRLQGLFGSILVLGVLFIWRNATSLVPHLSHAQDGGTSTTGKDAVAGFTNLLKRNISRHEILNNCVHEWDKANRYRKKLLKNEFKKIGEIVEHENALPSQQRQPVKAYQAITKILSERNIK